MMPLLLQSVFIFHLIRITLFNFHADWSLACDSLHFIPGIPCRMCWLQGCGGRSSWHSWDLSSFSFSKWLIWLCPCCKPERREITRCGFTIFVASTKKMFELKSAQEPSLLLSEAGRKLRSVRKQAGNSHAIHRNTLTSSTHCSSLSSELNGRI